jgi:epoxyqueuosine reductase
MRNIIRSFAKARHCIYGVTNAAPLDERLASAKVTPFVTKNTQKRIDPAQYLQGARSVIAIGVPYGDPQPLWPTGSAKITRMSVGYDYHIIIKNMLKELADALNLSAGHYICVDSGGLMEREFALRAGLGFRGKNAMLINPDIGSFFNIGLLITRINADDLIDSPVETDSPVDTDAPVDTGTAGATSETGAASETGATNFAGCAASEAGCAASFAGCSACDLCIRYCPGGALNENGFFDYTHCVAYLTQKLAALSPDEEKIAAGNIYGCDVCQAICSYNKFAAPQPTIDPQWIINLDENTFNKTLKLTSAGWRGLEILKRNARLALNFKL